jgi:hypothetical protein
LNGLVLHARLMFVRRVAQAFLPGDRDLGKIHRDVLKSVAQIYLCEVEII